jgi:hypothetical protein
MFLEESCLTRIETAITRHGYCVIEASEGRRHANGHVLSESG